MIPYSYNTDITLFAIAFPSNFFVESFKESKWSLITHVILLTSLVYIASASSLIGNPSAQVENSSKSHLS